MIGLEMIGLDTNVVVRYLTHDDPAQTTAAVRVMDALSSDSPGFLSLIVIVELVWVLKFPTVSRRTKLSRSWRPYCEARSW